MGPVDKVCHWGVSATAGRKPPSVAIWYIVGPGWQYRGQARRWGKSCCDFSRPRWIFVIEVQVIEPGLGAVEDPEPEGPFLDS